MLPYAPWLCWLIPVIGAVFTPIFARINTKLRNYVTVAFVAASVVFSISMILDVFMGKAINWVSGEVMEEFTDLQNTYLFCKFTVVRINNGLRLL